MSPARVVVVVATYRRAEELRRLGRCLACQTHPVAAVVVADNADDAETRAVVDGFPVPATYLPMGANLGCGGGLRAAEEFLLGLGVKAAGPRAAVAGLPGDDPGTHWWILDDDAVPPPETLEKLMGALSQSGAGLAVPLLADELGRIWGFPEPMEPAQRSLFRETELPAEVARILGPNPLGCFWATGACQLVSLEAVKKAGLHRGDFWMLGEDLDFSMRVSCVAGAVFRTDVVVPHLPPKAVPGQSGRSDYVKFCSLLQNLTYLAVWNRGSAHMYSYLPGNFRRFFRDEGWGPARLRDAVDCLVSGFFGLPAGRGAGARIRRREAHGGRPWSGDSGWDWQKLKL